MKTLKQSIYEKLGTNLFKDMPSSNKDKYRRIEIKFSEYKQLYTDEVQKLIESEGFVFGANNYSITIAIAFKGNSQDTNYRKNFDEYKEKFQNLINKLDNITDIYFETGWSGNVGKFADKEIYSNIGWINKGEKINDEMKYNFNDLTPVKSYVTKMMSKFGKDNTTILYYNRNDINCYKKSSKNSTDIKFDDIKEEICKYADNFAKSIDKSYSVILSTGRRQSDYPNEKYEAFIVNKNKSQYGHFTITQNKFGDTSASVRIPLAGESKYKIDLNDWKKDIEKIIKYICS